MTDEATKQFLSSARAELVRVEIALSEMPDLEVKQNLLRDLLSVYGEPFVGGRPETVPAIAAPKDPEPKTPRVKAHTRPAGIPTNFMMTYEILNAAPLAGMTASEIVAKVRDRWWPGLVYDQFGPEFYRFVNEGRLARDDVGRMTVTDKGRFVATGKRIAPPVQSEPKPEPKPAPKKVKLQPRLTPEQIEEARIRATPASATAEQTKVALEHNDDKVMMARDEGQMANHLYDLMGHGFVDTEKLATVAGNRRGAPAKNYVEDLVFAINHKIARIKLKVVPYEKLGFYMREIS